MEYIALDLEWNQAVKAEDKVTEPVILNGEIIQIGAVKLNEKREIVSTFGTLVRPCHYIKMQDYVRKLTGIRERDLKKAPSFPEVFQRFQGWCGGDFCLLVWGGNDMGILRDNARLHGLDSSWLPKSYDLQRIYGRQFEAEKRAFSLAAAAEHLSLPSGGSPFHDARNDAMYTALVFQKVDWQRAMEEENAGGEQRSDRAVFTGYPKRSAVLRDRTVSHPGCPQCGRRLVQTRWISQKHQKWVMLGTCPLHGCYFFQLRLSMNQEGWRAVRQAVPAAQEHRDYYQQLQEKKKKRRRVSSAPRQEKREEAKAARADG